MKAITLFICLVLVSMMTSAQVVTLKFTMFFNFVHVDSDSIMITNLTHPGDTMLIWPDTVLVLGTTGLAGLPEKNTAFDLSLRSENPVNEKASLQLNLPTGGEVVVRVTDISGKPLTEIRQKMQAGVHRLSYTPSQQGLNLVTAYFNSESRSAKVISTAKGKGPNLLTYEGVTSPETPGKSANDTQTFTYAVGDSLKLEGFYMGLSNIQHTAPLVSTNYAFYISDGSCPGLPSFTYGGQLYHTIQIGTQCWMKENLNIGTMVTSVNTGASHSECSDNSVIEKYCYYNDTNNCNMFGGLYDWDEMMKYTTIEGVQGICPPGWHIPTNSEWCAMTMYLDPTVNCNALGYTGTNAGGMLKEAGITHWASPNSGANNSSGFTALGAGLRQSSGGFFGSGLSGTFWTSTEANGIEAAYWGVVFQNAKMDHLSAGKVIGCSLRCLRD